MTSVLLTLLLIVALLAAVFFIPRFLTSRAVRVVVSIFRQHNATSPTTAATLEELGLGQKGLREKMFRSRDYKPYALRMLVQADIIRATEEGKVYLSEEALENSPTKEFARIK